MPILVGQLQEDLDLSQEEMEHVLHVVSDHSESSDSSSTHSSANSEANMAKVGPGVEAAKARTPSSSHLVLMDSGANEVLRAVGPEDDRSHGDSALSVTLASGDAIPAYRNKNGEVCLPRTAGDSQDDGDNGWIVGIRRIIDLGGSFLWDSSGAHVKFPHPLKDETVRVECIIMNGLPYVRWADFKLLRIALSKRYKADRKGSSAFKAVTETHTDVVSWPIQLEEETDSQVNKADLNLAEEAARTRLECNTPLSHNEVLELVRMANLQPVASRQSGRVVNGGKFVRAWVFGSFVHGSFAGITNLTKQRPFLSRVLARYMATKSLEPFMSIVVADNLVFAPHCDRNEPSFKTTISGLTSFQGGQLWTHDESGEHWRMVREGVDPMAGRLHQISNGKSVTFNGTDWHGTEPYAGDRVVCVAYTPKNWEKVSLDDEQTLQRLGFRFPTRPCSSVSIGKDAQQEPEVSIDISLVSGGVKEERHAEYRQFTACKAIVGECDFENQILTLEEKRTLEYLGHQAFPQQQSQRTQPASMKASHHSHHTIQHHTAYRTDVVGDVGEVVSSVPFSGGGDDYGVELGVDSSGSIGDSAPLPVEPWDLSTLEDPDAETTAVQQVWKQCQAGLHNRVDEAVLRARGHRRPHRKISAKDIDNGVLSVDLSGPHTKSYGGNKYALIACAYLNESVSLPFMRAIPNKEAQTVTDALKDIMLQLVSMSGGEQVTFRLHSDQGKEFTAKLAAEELKPFNHFRTFAVPYSHQSNGRVEQLIDSLKTATAADLLQGEMDIRFWDEVMLHSCKLRRMNSLHLPIPKDLPRPGDYVLVRLPKDVMPDMNDKTERGMFLGLSEHVSNGARVVIERGDRAVVRYARLPILLNRPQPRWRVVQRPGCEETVWVSDQGKVAWDAPNMNEILTLEQKRGSDVRDTHDILDNLKRLLDQSRTADSVKEIFNLYSHGVFAKPETAEALVAQVNLQEEKPINTAKELSNDWLSDKRCWVCGKSASACLENKLSSVPHEKGGYQLDAADEETAADDVARLMAEIASTKASAETTDCRVFFEGSEEAKLKWLNGAKAEMQGMTDKGVLDSHDRDSLKQDLGLAPSDRLPQILPTKLVVSRKPDDSALEAVADKKTKKNQITEPPWKAKVRLCACGNFEANDGTDVTTQNVSSQALRIMGHELSAHQTWIAAGGDISLAFLNSDMDPSELVLLEPPSVLKRLGLVKPGTVWRARKHIYGLRRSPKAWGQLRDTTINGKLLKTKSGSLEVKLVPDEDGLFILVDQKSQQVIGIVAMYVDDIFAVGEAPAVAAFMSFIQDTWSTKFSGFITRGNEQALTHGEFTMERVPELTFIGLQVSFDEQKQVVFNQRRWILNELYKRGWVHMTGTPCLPQVELNIQESKDTAEFKANLTAAQTELGCLMWVGTKTRADILATVSIAASHLHKCPSRVLQVAKGCWRYLRATLDVGIRFKGSCEPTSIQVWSDASFSPEGSRSRTGGVLSINGCLLNWWTAKQSVTAWSVCEAETDAMATAVAEASKTLPLLESLTQRPYGLNIQVFGDNAASLTLAQRDTFFLKAWRTRAFALRASWLRDQIKALDLSLAHCPGIDLIADMLTKSLPKTRLAELRQQIGLS